MNSLIKKLTGWKPAYTLEDGLKKTYDWIESEMSKKGSNTNRFSKF